MLDLDVIVSCTIVELLYVPKMVRSIALSEVVVLTSNPIKVTCIYTPPVKLRVYTDIVLV
jgi:hypothetical protein